MCVFYVGNVAIILPHEPIMAVRKVSFLSQTRKNTFALTTSSQRTTAQNFFQSRMPITSQHMLADPTPMSPTIMHHVCNGYTLS